MWPFEVGVEMTVWRVGEAVMSRRYLGTNARPQLNFQEGRLGRVRWPGPYRVRLVFHGERSRA